jgi:hypothetical protein
MRSSSCLWWNSTAAAGFRFSRTDVAAIILCVLATWGAWSFLREVAILFPVVLGHFFLFCNIFRVRRKLELWWSAVFVVNVGVWLGVDQFTWLRVLLTQTPVTVLIVTMTVFGRDYHGVGYLLTPWGRRIVDDSQRGRDSACFPERHQCNG